MRRFMLLALIVLPTPALQAQTRARRIRALKSITPGDIKKHVWYLADDRLRGRESGKPGAHQAAVYLARQYRLAGVRPMGIEGSYFQPFVHDRQPSNLFTRGKLVDSNHLWVQPDLRKLKFSSFKFGKDFTPLVVSGTGYAEGRLVFAGYGIRDKAKGYDDYAGLTARKRVVLVLSGSPWKEDTRTLSEKIETAAKQGAAALLIVSDKTERRLPKGGALAWPPRQPPSKGSMPVLYLTSGTADKLLQGLGKRVQTLKKKIQTSGKPASYPTGSRTRYRWPLVRLQVNDKGAIVGGFKNVIGFKEGSHPTLKQQLVVVGGHYDHVGSGSFGSLGGKGQIHNGADDNASGTAGVLEIMQALQHVELKRSVLFISFDAEERGLLGSKYYCNNPVLPHKDTVAMFNMDMISRNGFNQIFIGAAKKNPTIYKILTDINAKYRISLRFDGMDKYTNRSDQGPFLDKGIPGIFFFGGTHKDYHTAGDDREKCNYSKARTITQLVFFVMYKVANLPRRP